MGSPRNVIRRGHARNRGQRDDIGLGQMRRRPVGAVHPDGCFTIEHRREHTAIAGDAISQRLSTPRAAIGRRTSERRGTATRARTADRSGAAHRDSTAHGASTTDRARTAVRVRSIFHRGNPTAVGHRTANRSRTAVGVRCVLDRGVSATGIRCRTAEVAALQRLPIFPADRAAIFRNSPQNKGDRQQNQAPVHRVLPLSAHRNSGRLSTRLPESMCRATRRKTNPAAAAAFLCRLCGPCRFSRITMFATIGHPRQSLVRK